MSTTSTARILSERLRETRTRRGLTQSKLAEAAGVTDETVSRIERGRYEPVISTLCNLARALDVSLDYLTGLKGQARIGSRPTNRAGTSPLVARVSARASKLTPAAQRVLTQVADLLPEGPHPVRSRARSSKRGA